MAACASGTAASASRPAPPSPALPGTQLSGAGAFLGPVHQVPVDGIRVGYRQFGLGPNLVMVTGETAPMSLWTLDLLGRLGRHFRVTIFDNRGVGYSTDDLSVPISVPLMAKDTVGLIRALGLGKPILLGWSMGGEIGLTIAARYPGVLGRLVTTGADPGGTHAVQSSPAIAHELSDPNITSTQLLDLIFPPSASQAKAAFVSQYLLVPQESVSSGTIVRQGKAEAAFARYEGTWDRLAGVSIPVLVTNGALDVVNPPANARVIAGRVKGAKMVFFAGAGHGMLFQDTSTFVNLVVKFAR